MVDFRLVFKCRVCCLFGWVRWSSRIGGVRGHQINLAMEFMKVIDISIMNRGTSQGKTSVVNGSLKFMREVKWTLSLGTKVGQRAVKNPLLNTYE